MKVKNQPIYYPEKPVTSDRYLKSTLHEPVKRFGKDIDINKSIKEFYDEVKKYKIDDIICIDETSIKSLQKRNRCYSEKGKRCVIKTQSQEVFKKYTGIFAISVNGVVGWDLYEKSGINSDRMVEFLEANITNKFKNKLIIMDNASSHYIFFKEKYIIRLLKNL